MRNETEGETAEYIEGKYGTSAVDVEEDDHWRLSSLRLATKRRGRKASLDEAVLPAEPSTASDYLARRGISAEIQRRMDTRFDCKASAIAFPWRLPNGRLANVKYRATWGKAFWYAKAGRPIRELVYGIDLVYRERPRLCAICEAEIDAMTVMEAGFSAVAVGGVALGQAKIDALVRAPVDEYVLLSDNDKAGEKLRAELALALSGHKRVSHARVSGAKDANEAGVAEVRRAIESRTEANRMRLYVS